MSVWQDFGQRVSLTSRIREILVNYPEGTGLLKELFQVRSFAKVWGKPLHREQVQQGV